MANTAQDFLQGRRVWISTSYVGRANDVRGRLVTTLVLEICRYIFAAEGTVAYGGDLRKGGITFLFYEAATRHFPEEDARKRALLHVLAEGSYAKLGAKEIRRLDADVAPVGEMKLIDHLGNVETEHNIRRHPLSSIEAAQSYTAMRKYLSDRCDALVAFGGREARAKATTRTPGVEEEVSLFGATGKPMYLLGGFGGVAERLSVKATGGEGERPQLTVRNGLDEGENARLVHSPHIDEVISLMLHGLRRSLV